MILVFLYILRRRKWFIVVIASCLLLVSLPEKTTAEGGKYAGSFLELGIGARALGLGGAFVGVADDGSAFYWNPAGLSLLKCLELDFMYASAFGSISDPLANFNHLGATLPMVGGASIAVKVPRAEVSTRI